jgi:copper chaperone
MTNEEFDVANVKCGGCATNIRNGLMELAGINAVEVEVATGHVQVSGDNLDREQLAGKLKELGYPEIAG